MSNWKEQNCHACGKEIGEGERCAHIRMGVKQADNPQLGNPRIWAVLHRRCLLETLRSPKAARMLLNESRESH